MKKAILFFLIVSYSASAMQSLVQDEGLSVFQDQDAYLSRSAKRKKNHKTGERVGSIVADIAKDIFILHKNLLSWNSYKVIATAFPFFIGARMIDQRLQSCFYDASCHKNVNQMPGWCQTVSKASIGIPILLLGSDFFFSKEDDKRYTAQILLLGMPFVIWGKKVVKMMKFEDCRRPWNENFSCEERSYGGFPSGHTAQAAYMAVLYGLRYGPRYSAPLGALTAFIGVNFVSCNRHYLSQVVGGAAFGTLYALAANKLVDRKMTNNVKLSLKVDGDGRPTFSMAATW